MPKVELMSAKERQLWYWRREMEWLDLYLGDYASCVQWGDQTRKVWKVTE